MIICLQVASTSAQPTCEAMQSNTIPLHQIRLWADIFYQIGARYIPACVASCLFIFLPKAGYIHVVQTPDGGSARRQTLGT